MSIVHTDHGTINVPETVIALEKRISALEAAQPKAPVAPATTKGKEK